MEATKVERERIQAEIQQWGQELNQLDAQSRAMADRRNAIVTEIVKRQGMLELLTRLDGKPDEENKGVRPA